MDKKKVNEYTFWLSLGELGKLSDSGLLVWDFSGKEVFDSCWDMSKYIKKKLNKSKKELWKKETPSFLVSAVTHDQ